MALVVQPGGGDGEHGGQSQGEHGLMLAVMLPSTWGVGHGLVLVRNGLILPIILPRGRDRTSQSWVHLGHVPYRTEPDACYISSDPEGGRIQPRPRKGNVIWQAGHGLLLGIILPPWTDTQTHKYDWTKPAEH